MFGILGHHERARHRFSRDNLSAFLDGRLPARDQERVRQHLAQCQACRWDLQSLQRTVDLLHSLPRVRAPRSFMIARSVPAPSLPFWMQPWAYGALRVATAAAAAFLVVALAGNVVALPGDLALRGARPRRLSVAAQPTMSPSPVEGGALLAEEGSAAVRTPSQETPSTRGEKTPEDITLPTSPCDHCDGVLELGIPTLAPEEVARATAAPPGLGMLGGQISPTVAAAPELAAGRGLPEPTPTPPPAERPTPAEQAAIAKALPRPAGGEPGQAWVEQPSEPTGHSRLRQWLSGYPWRWWAIGSSVLLVVLVAATLWLRAKRARWP